MSMLAEPRRKQKWSVDPRNSAWSNDESKFGQKMLERMGWSKGKGLGKSEQGSTEHIKVKVKNNSLGLGTSVNNEDNWIAHQDDFNQLLAELNSCHGQNHTDEPTQEQKQGFSLEEKSKTSKKRVHYMKFTKGKDLSSRSETDLACIFGKRSKREAKDQDEGSSGPDSQEEREVANDTENNPEEQLKTVTSTLSMREYFAQRMAQLKRSQLGNGSAASSPGVSSNAPSPAASTEDPSDMEQSKKKKKKKKRKQENAEDDTETADNVALTSVTEESVEEPSRSKKKQKKKKREREEKGESEESNAPTVIDDATEEEAQIPKKRSKKNKTSTETVNEYETVENVDTDVSHKKKKKRRKQAD
ncbi:PIN2/TERF1-interacting telomerase inhibitor 1 [Misgurnus anguillicaudatus]|uniref:PIN2/TERF1-interacting telomerase inhibitor 1 n=1 Tax=Misgurnus anguillicaudatus TaxID=75329 RepID=UPI003CCF6CB0